MQISIYVLLCDAMIKTILNNNTYRKLKLMSDLIKNNDTKFCYCFIGRPKLTVGIAWQT